MLYNEFNIKEKEIFRASDFMPRNPNSPKTIVSCFSVDLEQKLIERYNPKKIGEISVSSKLPIYEFEYNGKKMAFIRWPVGSSASAIMLEELSAFGFENFLVAGTCGVLDETLPKYALIVPTVAVRDEGTSFHYAEPSAEIELNKENVEKVGKYLKENGYVFRYGKTWTTDAIYRETKERAERRKKEGCICVEMECSALTAVSKLRGLNFAQVLYGADVVVEGKHNFRNMAKEGMDLTSEERILNLLIDLGYSIYEK